MLIERVHFDRILFPVDFSEESRRAVPFVRAAVDQFRAELLVMHVLEIPNSYYAATDFAGWEAMRITTEAQDTRRAALRAFITQEFRDQVVVVPEFAEGEPAREIVRLANENNRTLIMMPTHGYGTFRRLLLGSTTAKVLHDAECPVWTAVHIPADALSLSMIPQRILCAVDLGSDSVRLIRWATDFAGQVGSHVQLVHAVPGGPDSSFPPEEQYRQHLFELAHQELCRLQKEAGVNLHVTVLDGYPEEVIRKACQDLDADLVIIGRGRFQKAFGRLRSRDYTIIREAPCPVISL